MAVEGGESSRTRAFSEGKQGRGGGSGESIFTIHNEAINVWMHLIGFFLFLAMTVYIAMKVSKFVDLQSLQHLPIFMHSDHTSTPVLSAMKDDVANMKAPLLLVLVVAGAYTHYRAALVYLKWRDLEVC
ncbi:hypothetical protein OPV22_016269 [Ensete ventricosum]|uniref:Uncharacterized protein n=1 Tax=Ensete ventricosum TaxID=4639 RepID=A0AAV8QV21_ENSVE|nr:hypothetical protein OPV22_016269 [Ensete ventricosum]